MPTVTDLAKLDSLAQVGNVRFTGSMAGDAGEARTRIHFLTIDLGVANGGVHGFFMVYQAGTAIANPEDFVSASLPPAGVTYLRGSDNCGDVRKGRFLSAARHNPIPLATDPVDSVHRHHTTNAANNQDSALIRRTSVVTPDLNRDPVYCYLGGDSILTFPDAGAAWPTTGHRDGGAWVAAPAGIQASLASLGSIITDRPDAGYLFPLTRQWNTNFKGVIYVDGKVILDGVIRGRVTVAAAGNIIFGDDITYFQNPATRDCAFGDIAGYFSGQSIMVSNNTLNAPQTLNNNGSLNTSPAGTFRSYAATNDETIHGFFLTLKTFGAEENSLGSNTDQDCLIGGTFNSGRGCLRTYGGIIQERRGAVGLTGGEGYIKRYEYDVCGATNPPPYYPTTGVFVKNRFYELDPTRFSVAGWFAANQN
jgi:hypothetical protein